MGIAVALLAVLPVAVPPRFPIGGRPPGCLACKFGIALDLQPPACGVGEVQVEGIELVMGHRINLLLDGGFVEEMARDVDHQSPPRIAGLILNLAARHPSSGITELTQRLKSIEESCARGGGESYALRGHREPVSLLADGLGGEAQRQTHAPGISYAQWRESLMQKSGEPTTVGRREMTEFHVQTACRAVSARPDHRLRLGQQRLRANAHAD